jgi:hypothetical protein
MARALVSGALILAGVVLATAAGGGEESCGKCKPKKAAWPWKANGYAIGVSEAATQAEAAATAKASACQQAARYLDAQKLSCPAGCEAGDLEARCEASKEPCMAGSAEKNAGMWKFVCLKATGEPKACDEAARQASPFYAMCDVSVDAERVLTCGDGTCVP